MDTLLLIRQNYANFTPVEKKIADYILTSGEDFLDKSAQEVAKELKTSSAALVRFSRRLGYAGFAQLKQKLSGAYILQVKEQTYLEELKQTETPASLKRKFKAKLCQMLEMTNFALKDEDIQAVVKLFAQKELLFVFGTGAATLVAQDIFQKFSRVGKNVICLQDVELFKALLSVYQKQAIFIGIELSGETQTVTELAKVAQNLKIPVVGLSAKKDASIANSANHLLCSVETCPGSDAVQLDLFAQLYVVAILFHLFNTTSSGQKQT